MFCWTLLLASEKFHMFPSSETMPHCPTPKKTRPFSRPSADFASPWEFLPMLKERSGIGFWGSMYKFHKLHESIWIGFQILSTLSSKLNLVAMIKKQAKGYLVTATKPFKSWKHAILVPRSFINWPGSCFTVRISWITPPKTHMTTEKQPFQDIATSVFGGVQIKVHTHRVVFLWCSLQQRDHQRSFFQSIRGVHISLSSRFHKFWPICGKDLLGFSCKHLLPTCFCLLYC